MVHALRSQSETAHVLVRFPSSKIMKIELSHLHKIHGTAIQFAQHDLLNRLGPWPSECHLGVVYWRAGFSWEWRVLSQGPDGEDTGPEHRGLHTRKATIKRWVVTWWLAMP